MRMRATRTGATGCNARRLGLTIGQLLPAGAGRVAAIYTDPARPSWDEVIAQNRKALGPELAMDSGAKAGNVSAFAAFGQTAIQPVIAGRTYLVVFRVDALIAGTVRVQLTSTGSSLGGYAAATGLNFSLVLATANHLTAQYQGGASGFNGSVSAFSICEIADWSKCVLFDDANGTVPIFSVLQSARGRGLLLDRSQGLKRGPELVVNGTFDSSTAGWSGQAATLSQVAGALSVDAFSGAGGAHQDVPTVAERWYEITASVLSDVSASLKVYVGGAFTTLLYDGPVVTTARPIRAIFKATSSSSRVYLRNTGTSTVLYDNVSVREIPGNHMSQPTAPARGEFSARYNLLTGTPDLSGWTVSGVTVSDPGVSSPAGRPVRRLASTAYSGTTAAYVQVATTAGVSHRYRVDAKADGGGYLYLFINNSSDSGVYFNLLTGTIGNVVGSASAPTITPLWDGWFACEFSFSPTTASPYPALLASSINGTGRASQTGSAASAVLVSAPDFRLTVDAIPSVPAYQAVRTATDYDTVGYPVYHRQQTDDWARTRMNPNGATKVLVLTALQKFSNIDQMLLEMSTTSSGAALGVTALFISGQNLGYYFRTKGTVVSNVLSPEAPLVHRAALLGRGDIANDGASLAVNGGTTLGSGDQGTGAYTEQDIFIGSRAGTSLFANTETFAPETIIFCQPADTINPSHVARLQKAYAKAAGVTL